MSPSPPCKIGDLSRLGIGERNSAQAEGPTGPSERARASHWVGARWCLSFREALFPLTLTPNNPHPAPHTSARPDNRSATTPSPARGSRGSPSRPPATADFATPAPVDSYTCDALSP